MVSCGTLRCAWEKDTDFRGLSRHRSTCKHYQKASTLAAQKRRDRARESMKSLESSPSQITTRTRSTLVSPRFYLSSSLTSNHSLAQLGSMIPKNNRCLKPIACCEFSEACMPTAPIHPGPACCGIVRASASTSAFLDTDILGYVMDDTTEQPEDNNTLGAHLRETVCRRIIVLMDDY